MGPDKLLAEWFWIDRWTGSRAFSLPIAARGLYREMLTQAWRRGAQLPNNHQEIRRLTGVTAQEWKRLWPKVRQFWAVKKLGRSSILINSTQVEIYAVAKERAEKAHNRAIRGAQARAEMFRKQRSSVAQAQLEDSPPITSHQVLPPVVPLKGGRVTRRELQEAERVRNLQMGCRHDPRCENVDACLRLMVHERRQRKAAS